MTSDDDEAITRSKDWFVERLSAYGIGEDRIHVTYQDFLQDYEITISGGLLTEEQVEGVQKVTRDGGCVVFENSENAGLFSRFEARDGREMLKAFAIRQAQQMSNLPRFDPTLTRLEDFVRELEAHCGLEPGTMLTVVGDRHVELRVETGTDPRDFQKLFGVAMASLIPHDIEVEPVGPSFYISFISSPRP